MMKRLLILILFLVISGNCFAGSSNHVNIAFVESGGGTDGSIGQTDISGGSTNVSANFVYFSEYTASPGQVSYGHIYMGNLAGEVTLIIYNSAGEVFGYGAATIASNTTTWYHFTLAAPVTLASETYYIGIVADNGGQYYADSSGTGNVDYNALTYTATPTANTAIPGTDSSSNNMAITFNELPSTQ